MITVRNHAKERLEAGELALGVGLRQARTVDIAKIMKTAGYDFLFIDMEHNSMSIDLAAQISVAAQDAGITPVVRVPAFEHFHATRALEIAHLPVSACQQFKSERMSWIAIERFVGPHDHVVVPTLKQERVGD